MVAVSQDELLRLIAEAIGLTDELVKQYPKQGKWDDALAAWAYSKGFLAGVQHARSDESLMMLLREKDAWIAKLEGPC